MPEGKYCVSTSGVTRRKTRTVMIGDVPMGSEHPIVLQTMTTTDTRDVEATVAQVKKIADKGGMLARITVQGMREAKACKAIRDRLNEDGYSIPLCADIHFAPKVALLVAESWEKIRVNPGNFADGRKTFEEKNYDSPEAYQEELDFIEETFTPLVLKCKELGRCIRIGTNHGSLSARTLSYYGDTPQGMVESAFEFARICRKHDFHNFVFSMKASNPLVMVQAYRLLASELYRLGWDYPMHLGVTEAGDGEDGRMKSAIGIGSLLMDGLGDTIRVSLTEDPELEIVPCGTLATLGTEAAENKWQTPVPFTETARDFLKFERRRGELVSQREDDTVDLRAVLHRDGSVLARVTLEQLQTPEALYQQLGCKLAVGMPFKDVATVDTIVLDEVPAEDDAEARRTLKRLQDAGLGVIAPAAALEACAVPASIALYTIEEALARQDAGEALPKGALRSVVQLSGTEDDATLGRLKELEAGDCIFLTIKCPAEVSRVHASRRIFEAIARDGVTLPVIHHLTLGAVDSNNLLIRTGAFAGGLLCDGLGDGTMLEAEGFSTENVVRAAFGLLQGSRMRSVKTEYVSCPSCGRTLFDLQEVTEHIAESTGHLPGVTIAVMGCIVNGPGEMADADFGYVGSLPGKIDLYVGKEVVRRGIPQEDSVRQLVELLKEHGRWEDKEEAEEGAEEVLAA